LRRAPGSRGLPDRGSAVSIRDLRPLALGGAALAAHPEANLTSTFGLFAPAATPAPVVQRVADELARLLAQPELRQRLVDTDNVPASLGPAEFGALVRREFEANARIVKAADIRAE
jgi:hypothetical protein